MGMKITGIQGNSKQQFTVATQAAGSLTLGAGEIGIFIGDTAKPRFSEIYTGLEECSHALREAGIPVSGNTTYARKTMDGQVVQGEGAAPPAIGEDEVMVMYDDTFGHGTSSQIVHAHVTRLTERWLEESKGF